MNGVDLILPAGFRFHPTDDELVTHYLCRRCAGLPISISIIAEVDIYKFDPWQLPGMAVYGEKEWYFFSPRDRKYPNGSRPNRAAGSGYWKATGADKPIGSPKSVAIKKALVFYTGKAPRGVKTNWIMHEYRLAGVDRSVQKKNSLRLDDWVLCRLYHKKRGTEYPASADRKPAGTKNAGRLQPKMELLPQMPQTKFSIERPPADMLCFDKSDSLPQLHGDSSCGSEPALSQDFTCDKEIESQHRWGNYWENAMEFPLINGDVTCGFPPMSPPFENSMQDMFAYNLHKPF